MLFYTGFAGLMGDRIYGVIAEDGDPAFPWHTGRATRKSSSYTKRATHPATTCLCRKISTRSKGSPGIKPIYPDDEAFAVNVKTPDGKIVGIESREFLDDLQKTTDRSLRVHMTQQGQHDCRPVSIFSLSALAALSEETGMKIDKRRFRANFYVEWENQDDPYYEFSLVGKSLKIGDKLEVRVIERDPRCKMITLDPDTSDESPKLLQHVSRRHGGNAGVFAAVLSEGRVKKGDPIYLT